MKSNGFAERNELPRSLEAELDLPYSLEQIKQEVSLRRRLMDVFCGGSDEEPKSDHFEKICGLCLLTTTDQGLLNKMRTAGLGRLEELLSNMLKRECLMMDTKLLMWCLLSLLSFFHQKHLDHEQFCGWLHRRKFDAAKDLFHNAMYMMMPEKQSDVLRHSVGYFRITQLWHLEDYLTLVFQEIMSFSSKPEMILAKIVKEIEINQRRGCWTEARNITSSLALILEHKVWDRYLLNRGLHNCFNALLKLYLMNDFATSETKISSEKFRMEIKNCVKYFISNIKDNKGLVSVLDSLAKCLGDVTISVEDRLELCDVMIFCAQHHHASLYRETLTPDLLDFLLENIRCDDRNLAIVGHRVLHHLLDRHGNVKYFAEPVYYFKGRFDFAVNTQCDAEDMFFFKSASQLYKGIQHCLNHFTDKTSLTTCYITMCLILVEIPQPIVTINIIHILVITQNAVLKSKDEYPMPACAHIQAIVISVMSLICVAHWDEVEPLRRYVDQVAMFRHESAPYLLPPLNVKYSLAGHHTTEYHEQLYFLEEEILYVLQRCWLGKRTPLQSKSIKSMHKPMNNYNTANYTHSASLET